VQSPIGADSISTQMKSRQRTNNKTTMNHEKTEIEINAAPKRTETTLIEPERKLTA
jgi:hypothetical protein